MALELPFHSISNGKLGKIYSSGRRLRELLEGRCGNTRSIIIAIQSRRDYQSTNLKSLDLMLLLPPEIQYEVTCLPVFAILRRQWLCLSLSPIHQILYYLHPLELYNICQSKCSLRNVILARSHWIWPHSFERHPELPPPPDGCPRFRWCHVLFGPECKKCLKEKARLTAQKLNYTSSEDLCMECSSLWHFPTSEMEHIGDVLREFQTAVHGEGSFISEEGRPRKHVELCKIWAKKLKKENKIQEERQKAPVRPWLLRRFAALGYDKKDISEFLNDYRGLPVEPLLKSHGRSFRELRRRWKNYSPALETRLKIWVELREEDDEDQRREMRATDIQTMYLTLVEELYGSAEEEAAIGRFPSATSLLLYEPFWTKVTSDVPLRDEKGELLMDEFKNEFYALSLQTNSWRPGMTLDTLANICSLIKIPPSCSDYGQLSVESPAACFRCPICARRSRDKLLVGWNNVLAHRQWACLGRLNSHCFEFNERGCHAGIAVLKALDLDPLVTDVQAFENGEWFWCLKCPELLRSCMLMTWEDCIAHHADFANDASHSEASFEVLALSELDTIPSDLSGIFC